MDLKFFLTSILFTISKASVIDIKNSSVILNDGPNDVFNGVYSECFLHLSYPCLQKKTLLYLKELNNLSEVSVIGDYVKFVKINKSDTEEGDGLESKSGESEELASMIDDAIDHFFDNHVLKFYALGRNISMPRNVEEFVGRKKRKGGGGGGGGHGGGGGGGHDDGGKKKMMMMAMMCMKMKLMMMVPAMMGMMGMMSFKGMMFSMMSFMISKMMLLIKILERKGGSGLGGGGGSGGGGGGGFDGGWAAGGAGGGAWMPAGGQDYAGGGGGGYDANGQWQSRSIVENLETYKTIESSPTFTIIKPINSKKWIKDKTKDRDEISLDSAYWKGDNKENKDIKFIKPIDYRQWSHSIDPDQAITKNPEISFVKRAVRYNNKIEREPYKKPVLVYKRSNVNFEFDESANADGQANKNINVTVNSKTRFKREIETQETPMQREIKTNLQIKNSLNDNIREQYIDNNKGKANVRTANIFKLNRRKRSIIDILQNSYIYWVNRILGLNSNRRTNTQKYKIVNGIKYVYYPYRIQKLKMPKEMQIPTHNEELKPLVAVEDFNKGEIVEGGIESRMNKKKFNKMKDSVNDTVEDNPWE